MAERKGGDRRTAQSEGGSSTARTELERAQRRGELGEGERDSIRPHSRAGKKLARDRGEREAEKKRAPASPRRSDRGRHRGGRLELDAHPGLAFAGRRAREAGQDGRAPDAARHRPGSGIVAVSNAVRRARAGLQDGIARSVPSFFSDRPASAKRNSRARWRNFCSTTRTP